MIKKENKMKTIENVNSIQKIARIAGLLTLMIVVFAPFSMVNVPSTLIVPGDAGTTANHIIASEGLFRLSIASDSIVFLIEIVLTVLLYVLIKPVGKTLSMVATFSRLAMTIIQGINLLNHFFALLLFGVLTGSGWPWKSWLMGRWAPASGCWQPNPVRRPRSRPFLGQ